MSDNFLNTEIYIVVYNKTFGTSNEKILLELLKTSCFSVKLAEVLKDHAH